MESKRRIWAPRQTNYVVLKEFHSLFSFTCASDFVPSVAYWKYTLLNCLYRSAFPLLDIWKKKSFGEWKIQRKINKQNCCTGDLIKSVADTKSSRPDISKTSTRSIHRSLRVGITASKKERNSKNTGYEGKNVNTKTLFPRETASLPPSPHRGNAWKSGRTPPPLSIPRNKCMSP